jgi:penicillin-binding protein 2
MIWARLHRPAPDQAARRVKGLTWALALAMAVLALRVAHMQVWQGAHFRELAVSNSVRTVPQRAPRGQVLDRHLQVLVGNAPAISVGLTPAELPRDRAQAQAVIAEVARLLKLDAAAVAQKVERQSRRPYAPARLAADVDRALVARLEDRRLSLPGLSVWEDSKRSYPLKAAAHVVGYVGEITERQLGRLRTSGYRLGDWLGQAGVEAVYDGQVKGSDGGKQVRINASGRELGVLKRVAPVPGDNLVLSLDGGLQAVAEEALGREAGAIVALDPRNGEILALVSKPDFDPATFAGRVDPRAWAALLNDERRPMNNRAVQGLYPPGSVFKVFTALAALHEGTIRPDEPLNCYGIFWISTWPYRCWREIGHGAVSMERSLVESCDIYFYQLGLRLRVEALARWSRDFGFGEPTGIDLPGELGGVVPDPAWKQAREGLPWFPGNTVMMSIGQGYLLSTPLQLAVATAAVANGGRLVTPHLLKRVTSPQGELRHEHTPPPPVDLDLDPEALHLVRRAMEGAVQERRGTAWRARVPGLSVAGKTGTAQNPHGEDHAAFVAFAPVESPRVVIAIIVENGGEGGLTAAPIARRMLEHLFRDGR